MTFLNGTVRRAAFGAGLLAINTLSLWAQDRRVNQVALGPVKAATGVLTGPLPLAGAKPLVDLAPYDYANQKYSACAQSCFALVVAKSSVPYYSLSVPRSVTLVYNQDRVDPKPFVHVDVADGGGSIRPVRYQLRIRKQLSGDTAQIVFLNGDTVLTFDSVPATFRLGGQFRAADNQLDSTGVYPISVRVRSIFSDSTKLDSMVATKVTVVNETNSAFARGWNIAGIQHLYVQSDSGVLITEGDGSATYFRKSGAAWLAPPGEFSSLIRFGASSWRRSYPDSSYVAFNGSGQIIGLTDSHLNATAFQYYDGYRSGLLQYIVDPQGMSIRLNYGAWGLDSIIDPMGRGMRIDVDRASRRVNQIVDWDLVATNYRYDALQRLDSVQDRRGFWTSFRYATAASDSSYKSDKVVEIQTDSVTLSSGSKVRPTTALTPWQKFGVPYKCSTYNSTACPSPTLGGPILTGFVRAVVTDPVGHSTRFTVTGWGAPLIVYSPLDDTTRITYTSGRQVSTMRLPSYTGVERDSLAYNGSGMVTYSEPAGRAGTNYRYPSYWPGRPDSVWGTNQVAVRDSILPSGVAGRGQPIWHRLGSVVADSTHFTYDSHGRMLGAVDAQGHSLGLRTYAGRYGNVSRDSLPGNRLTTFTQDFYGRDSVVKAPSIPAKVTTYDAMNRPLLTFTAGQVDTVRRVYDNAVLTHLIAMRFDSTGRDTTRYFVNALGLADSVYDALHGRDQYQYDADGQLLRWTTRRGRVVDFAYDSLHRLVSKTGDSAIVQHVRYSDNGRIVRDSNATASDSVFLNVTGQPDSVVKELAVGKFRLHYWYSASGRLDSVSSPSLADHAFTYRPERGTLESLTFSGLTSVIKYNKDLRDTAVSFPSGQTITRPLLSIHDAIEIRSNVTPDSFTTRVIDSDSLGRIRKQLHPTSGSNYAGNTYTYDSLSRLTSDSAIRMTTVSCGISPDYGETCTGGFSVESARYYDYDAAGNRHDFVDAGTYGTGNRITAYGTCTYTTNADGTVATRGTCTDGLLTIKWNSEGNLPLQIVNPDHTYDFAYDPDGRLVSMKEDGSPYRYFLWNGDALYAEYDGGGTRLTQYSWYPGLDNLHQFANGGTIYDVSTDARGNVFALTTSSGVRKSYEYDAWGQDFTALDVDGLGNRDRMRFKGALTLPELRLNVMRNRWYEPFTGRFLSEDPVGRNGRTNLYAFAGNDPVNGADPTGLFWICLQVEYHYTWGMTGVGVECEWFPDSDGGGSGPGGPGGDDAPPSNGGGKNGSGGGGDEGGGGGGGSSAGGGHNVGGNNSGPLVWAPPALKNALRGLDPSCSVGRMMVGAGTGFASGFYRGAIVGLYMSGPAAAEMTLMATVATSTIGQPYIGLLAGYYGTVGAYALAYGLAFGLRSASIGAAMGLADALAFGSCGSSLN